MSTIHKKSQWISKSYSSNGSAIESARFECWGWLVDETTLPAGAVLISLARDAIPREQAPNIAMYTGGLATVSHNGVELGARVPGLYTPERPPQPAGKVVVTAVEETVLWCFNYMINNQALPELIPVRLQAGDEYSVPAGVKLFVLRGSSNVVSGRAVCFTPDAATTIVATGDFYAFEIKEARE